MSKVTIGEITTSCLGKMLDSEKNQGEYEPYLANLNVRWGSFVLDNLQAMRFRPEEQERYEVRDGDLVMCEGGEPGRCAIWRGAVPNMKIQKALHRIRAKEGTDIEYLYYWFLYAGRRHLIDGYFTGSTIKHLPGDKLKQIEIDLPDYLHQKSISAVLSCIDSKIQNNIGICADLEAMAKLLYDYWFVQFDFPDENGRPYKSSGGKMVWNEELKREIPEGWEVNPASTFLQTVKGISYSAENLVDGETPMFNLNSFNEDGTYKVEGIKSYKGNIPLGRFVQPNDLIMCVTQQTDIDLSGKRNVIGKTLLVPEICESPMTMSMDVVKLIPVEMEMTTFFKYLFGLPFVHKYIVGYANGTKIKHLDVEGALSVPVVMPGKGVDLIQRFNAIALRIHTRISNAIVENQRLVDLRDFLLPMLMNGQVKVGE